MRKPYERIASMNDASYNYRNGNRNRSFFAKHMGELTISIPRDRNGEFQSKFIHRYECREKAVNADAALLFLRGLSTRGIDMLSQKLLGKRVDRGSVSEITNEVADGLRDIFYASDRPSALRNFEILKEKYEKDFPSATKSLENAINSALTFFSFTKEEWISLRTTNPIERVNKELKRRTKPMEILAGESSSYKLLCFVALKMEECTYFS